MDLNKFISIIIFIGATGILIKVIYIYYFYIVRIKFWYRTEGEILDSGAEYFVSNTDVDTAGWRYKVLYKYKVDGEEYFNNVIGKNIGVLVPWEESINNYENKFQKGKSAAVFYNPNNYRDSVIDDKFSLTNFIPIFISIIAVFVAVSLWGK